MSWKRPIVRLFHTRISKHTVSNMRVRYDDASAPVLARLCRQCCRRSLCALAQCRLCQLRYVLVEAHCAVARAAIVSTVCRRASLASTRCDNRTALHIQMGYGHNKGIPLTFFVHKMCLRWQQMVLPRAIKRLLRFVVCNGGDDSIAAVL